MWFVHSFNFRYSQDMYIGQSIPENAISIIFLCLCMINRIEASSSIQESYALFCQSYDCFNIDRGKYFHLE